MQAKLSALTRKVTEGLSWKRVFFILLGAAICLAAALILLLVYFAVYQLVTPEACLTPGQWEKLWRVIP